MEIKERVKEKYGQATVRVNAGGSSCCGTSAELDGRCDPITSNLYVSKLARGGFDGIEIEPTRIYNVEDARTFRSGQGVDVNAFAPQVQGKSMSAFIRAVKLAACRASGCCA